MQLYKIARSIQNCFKTPTGEYIDTDTGEVLDEEYLNKKALTGGEEIAGATLLEKQNIQIS